MIVWLVLFLVEVNGALPQTPPLVSYRSANRHRINSYSTDKSTPTTSQNRFDLGLQTNSPTTSEHLFSRLEELLTNKVEALKGEVSETNRRLLALEWQSVETNTKLENLRSDLSKYTDPEEGKSCSSGTTDLESKTENLSKGIQLLIASMRILNSEVAAIRKNVSILTDSTRGLWHSNGVDKMSLVSVNHNLTPRQPSPRSCNDYFKMGRKSSGIYRIQPERANVSFMVFCDMDTLGGGWTVIHNRYDGTEDFYRNWNDYKQGFGNIGGEFWLGLEKLHLLTGYEVNELLVQLEDLDRKRKHAHYTSFSVGSEAEGYPLHVLSGYSGDAGDSLAYHAGCRFSTKDKDQDGWAEGSCAQSHGGAWWYRGCDTSNLNGRYLNGELPDQYIYQGMYWAGFRGPKYSLSKARMLVRSREEK